jgi:hypothetical protein
MSKRPTIYTVGDSHGWHTWLNIHDVKTDYVGGPMTMYSFGSSFPVDQVRDAMKSIPLDAIICFCHGEIDCRCYIHTHQPWQLTIDSLVEKYIRTIDLYVIGRNPKLIWTYCVVPPVRNAIASEGYPFRGTIEERIVYAKYMNKKLKEAKYTFIDLYNQYSDLDGCMKEGIHDAHVHIEDPKILTEWIDSYALSQVW